MKKVFLILTVVMVMFAAVACMSEQERALKDSVDEYAATLPSEVATGVVIKNISYTPGDSTVTLVCNIENDIMAATLKHTTGAVKAVFIPYLKSQKDDNEMLQNIVAASASLKCVFMHADNEIGNFTVKPSDL